jgi:hypothetical protein
VQELKLPGEEETVMLQPIAAEEVVALAVATALVVVRMEKVLLAVQEVKKVAILMMAVLTRMIMIRISEYEMAFGKKSAYKT